MQGSSLNLNVYAPTFMIYMDGEPQDELKNAVISLDVDENLESSSMFTLNLNEGWDFKKQNFKWLDSELLSPEKGMDVKIYIYYANHPIEPPEDPLFTGKIIALNPSFPSTGVPTLRVQGYDHSFNLKKLKIGDVQIEKKDSYESLIGKIVPKEQELIFGEIDSKIKPCRKITPHREYSVYDFLSWLAKRIGYEFFVRNKKIYFRDPMNQKEDPNKMKVLNWGKELISFNPRLSTAGIVSKVTVRGSNHYNPSELIVGTAKPKDIESNEPKTKKMQKLVEEYGNTLTKSEIEIIKNIPVCNSEDAKAVAKALLSEMNNSLIEASCECIGDPELKSGTTVNISGIGKRFSGKYYVTSVKHSIGDGYTTSFEARRGSVGNIGSGGE